MKYQYTRACSCGNVDLVEVTRRELAFNLKHNEIWNQQCSKCKDGKCSSLGREMVSLDKELLLEWANDPELFLMEQDQDLILAEENYLELILDIIDNHEILIDKRHVLVGALCVLVYDNSREVNKNLSREEMAEKDRIAQRVVDELKLRLKLVQEADDWIMDYITKIVYPKIGL